jgi:HlyD family secretion protein
MAVKQKKLLTILLIATILLIVLVVAGKNAGWFGNEYTYKVSVEKPQNRKIMELVTANGKVQPETEVKISPEVSGEIVEITIEEGDAVEQGDLLVRIKPDTYLSLVERAEASLNSARAQFANARAGLAQVEAKFNKADRDYKRSQQLWEEQTISEAEYETALSTFEMARAELEAANQSVLSAKYAVESARASLKETRENLKKTSLYAPMSGTVSRLNVEVGETVVGTMQMAGTELLRIADLNRMEVKVDVNENDIIKVELNDTCIVEIDAYMGRTFEGVVSEIANSASVEGASTDQVTSFEVKVYLLKSSYDDLIRDENPYPFRPGLSATVDIKTQIKEDALSVPIQAVTTRPDTTSQEALNEVVFALSGDSVQVTSVKTGIQDNQYIEILEGLEPDQQVVVAPYSDIATRLQDGDKVSIVEKKELYQKQ